MQGAAPLDHLITHCLDFSSAGWIIGLDAILGAVQLPPGHLPTETV